MKHDKRILPSLLAGLILSIVVAPARAVYPELAWARGMAFPGTGASYPPHAIAVDNNGDVVVAAVFTNTTGGGPFFFGLWKYSSNGTLQWSAAYGGARPESTLDVCTDAYGNIVLTGSFTGAINFGFGDITAVGGHDVFIVKFNSSGLAQWSRGFGSLGDDKGRAVRVNSLGHVLVTGTHFGVDMGGGVLDAGMTPDFSFFFAEYTVNGLHMASRAIVWGGAGTVRDMAVAENGAVSMTGEFPSLIYYGGTTLQCMGGPTDGFIARHNADGTVNLLERFGDGGADAGYAVAIAANGELLLTGKAFNRVVVGNRSFSNMNGFFVASYGADGRGRWAQANTGSPISNSAGYAVAPRPGGGAVVMGYFTGNLTVGIDHTLQARGTNNLFAVRYDSGGNPIWEGRFGGSLSVKGGGIGCDPSGNVIVSSPNRQSLTLCTGQLPLARGFVLKFEPEPTNDTQAPSVPTNLSYDGITLRWGGSVDPEGSTVRYAVYTSMGAFPGGLGVETSTRSYFYYAQVSHENFLYVTAIDCYDNMSGPSVRVEIHPSWTGPLAPANLVYDGPNLSWTAPTDTDIAHYVVHASPTPNWNDPGRTRIGLTPATSFDVRLRSAPHYFVTAVDIYGIWGEHASLPDGLAPPVPTGLRFVGNRLYWDASLDRGFANFDLYSSPSPNFEGNGRVHLLTTRHLDMYVPKPNRNAYYFITQTDVAGNTSSAGGTGGGLLAEAGEDVPNYQFAFSVHPNPARGQMNFAYTLPSTGRVSIRVYNVTGSLVATIVDSEIGLGDHSANWNGRVASGSPVSAGIYFARIDYAGRSETRKLVLLR